MLSTIAPLMAYPMPSQPQSSQLQPLKGQHEPKRIPKYYFGGAKGKSASGKSDTISDKEAVESDGVYLRPLTDEELASNTTRGSLARSAVRLGVAQPPSMSELCAFGRALPQDLVSIVILGPSRAQRVRRAAADMCLPNLVLVEGVAPFHNESEVPVEYRMKLHPSAMEELSFGEIAIHISHRRALERCLKVYETLSPAWLARAAAPPDGTTSSSVYMSPPPTQNATAGRAGCLIMEDDFALSGPRPATRWARSYAALKTQPRWDLLFLGRCMDGSCGRSEDRIPSPPDVVHSLGSSPPPAEIDHAPSNTRSDLYRVPARTIPLGEEDWQTMTPECLHAYMVTQTGADRMIHALGDCPGMCPADWAPAVIANASDLYAISPGILTQSTALRLDEGSGSAMSAADEQRAAGPAASGSNTYRPALISECRQMPSPGMGGLPASVHAPWFRTFGGPNAHALDAQLRTAHIGAAWASQLESGEPKITDPEENAPPPTTKRATATSSSTVRSTAGSTTIGAGSYGELSGSPNKQEYNGTGSAGAGTQPVNATSATSTTSTASVPPAACLHLEQRLLEDGAKKLVHDSAWQPGAEVVDVSIASCALQYVLSPVGGQPSVAEQECRVQSSAQEPLKLECFTGKCDGEQDVANKQYARTGFRCPFDVAGGPDARMVSTALNYLTCASHNAGYLTKDEGLASVANRDTATVDSPDEIHFQETDGWPRPATCAWRTSPRMNYKSRVSNSYRSGLTKWVNAKQRLEFRPVLKAGSTVLSHLLECLQPGEWDEVHQSTPMPHSHMALVVVRDPIRRFASALTEVTRRIFTGVCPDGPCNFERDYYSTTDGNHDSADDLARHTTWFRHALALYRGERVSTADASAATAGAITKTDPFNMDGAMATEREHVTPPLDRNATVRAMMTAAVTDLSCVLDYYGAEHFMSQMQLSGVQGTPLVGPEDAPRDRARFITLESIGRTAKAVRASSLFGAIGVTNVSDARLEQCVRTSFDAAHNTAADAQASQHDDDDEDAGAPTGFGSLPTEAETYDALTSDEGLLLALCHVFAQDFVCLSGQYEVPDACRPMLGWTRGAVGAPSSPL